MMPEVRRRRRDMRPIRQLNRLHRQRGACGGVKLLRCPQFSFSLRSGALTARSTSCGNRSEAPAHGVHPDCGPIQ